MTQPKSQQTQQAPVTENGEIDLRQLVSVLLKYKNIVISVSVLGVMLGVGGSLLSTRYVTEGLLLTPGFSNGAQRTLSVRDLKRYESVVYSGARLEDYLRISDQIETLDGQRLVEMARTPNGLKGSINPEFALTDKDRKAFGLAADGDDQNSLIGLRLRYQGKEATNGSPLPLLAEFVRDSMIRVTTEAETLQKCSAFRAKEQELRNAQIQAAFAITQEEKRAKNLREIIARNPNASATETRQIVSVEKGTERFLSPAAQLVAAEVQISDLRLADAFRERERVASELKRQYYCDANAMLAQPLSGRGYLEQLASLQDATFAAHDKQVDIIEQTWNELDLERTQWSNVFLSSVRFVASPEGTEVKQRKPGMVLSAVLGGMLGGMLGILIALIRAWWRGGVKEFNAAEGRAR